MLILPSLQLTALPLAAPWLYPTKSTILRTPFFGCNIFSSEVAIYAIVLVILPVKWFYFSLQVLTEYVLVSVTSAVTVTIAGIVKEAVTILV